MKPLLFFAVLITTSFLFYSGCGTDEGGGEDGYDTLRSDIPFDYREDVPVSCTPGRVYCEGTIAATCNSEGNGFENYINCAEMGRGCSDGYGCTVCSAGEGVCEGNVPKRCKPDGSGWDYLAPCDESAGYRCENGGCISLCDSARASSSYIGCDYWAVSTANSQLGEEFQYALVIANPNEISATVTVSDGMSYSNSITVGPGGLETMIVPYKGDVKLQFNSEHSILAHNAAYSITSTVPVTIYQFNPLRYMVNGDCTGYDPNPFDGKCYSYTNDASLLLPSHVLTGNYLVIARPTMTIDAGFQLMNSPGYVAIVGINSSPTNVSITFSARTYASADGSILPYNPGEVGMFTLNQHDVLQIISDMPSSCNNPDGPDSRGYTYCQNGVEYDLTGTRIEADQPVAVFSGHNCTFVPYNRWACDHLEQQLFPLETWGKEYVVFRTEPMFTDNPEPNVWKIISGKDGNVITFDPPTVHPDVTLNYGQWLEFESGESFKVSGTEGFMMAQFMVGMNYYGLDVASPDGDPAMCLAVPYEQYRDEYTFLTPETYERSFVNITVSSGMEGSIQLDGNPIWGSWAPVGSSGFVGVIVELNPGTHRITGDGVFGIIVYGVGDYTSYMYPGGVDLEKIFVI